MSPRPEPCDWCHSAVARKWRNGAHVCWGCAQGHDRQRKLEQDGPEWDEWGRPGELDYEPPEET